MLANQRPELRAALEAFRASEAARVQSEALP
jgi:hypothetical protein